MLKQQNMFLLFKMMRGSNHTIKPQCLPVGIDFSWLNHDGTKTRRSFIYDRITYRHRMADIAIMVILE